MKTLLAFAAALALGGGAADAAPFRIAAVGPGAPGCQPVGQGAGAGERAYYAHLAKRLEVEVLRCPVATPAAAASALAARQVDLALLDGPAFEPVRKDVRAILTVRPQGAPNRIPVVLAVRAADSRRSLASLKGAGLAFGGRSPASLDTPRAVLAVRGAGAGYFREEIAPDGEVALERLRAGKVDAAVVHTAAWQRVCRMVSPKIPEPCRDLFVVLKSRPRADRALAVRRDMPLELRYRLIGIHMAMHLDAPAAFAFASNWAKSAAEFQPAEADALTLADLK